MRISSIVAGASAAMVVLQAAYCATRGETFLLRPPGAHGESDFSAHCIKCGACMQACPYLAIRPAGSDVGMAVGTPIVDARSQACRLCEDFPCVAACPTGALRDICLLYTSERFQHEGDGVIVIRHLGIDNHLVLVEAMLVEGAVRSDALAKAFRDQFFALQIDQLVLQGR